MPFTPKKPRLDHEPSSSTEEDHDPSYTNNDTETDEEEETLQTEPKSEPKSEPEFERTPSPSPSPKGQGKEPGPSQSTSNSNSNSNSNSTPASQATGNRGEIICSYTNDCGTNPSGPPQHLRKVISHIFGRNKTATKHIPDWIFAHFCRKHYQRARYRASVMRVCTCSPLGDGAGPGPGPGSSGTERRGGEGQDQDGEKGKGKGKRKKKVKCDGSCEIGGGSKGKGWALKQCQLVEDALNNMEGWGGVGGFVVRLRRREEARIAGSELPVPVLVPSPSLSSLAGALASGGNEGSTGDDERGPDDGPGCIGSNQKPKPEELTSKPKQKRPAVPAPAPEEVRQWVLRRDGRVLSFKEVRVLIQLIEQCIRDVILDEGEEVRFPDIEILPVFGNEEDEEEEDSSRSSSCLGDPGDGPSPSSGSDTDYDHGSDAGTGPSPGSQSGSGSPAVSGTSRKVSRVSKKGGVQKTKH